MTYRKKVVQPGLEYHSNCLQPTLHQPDGNRVNMQTIVTGPVGHC